MTTPNVVATAALTGTYSQKNPFTFSSVIYEAAIPHKS